MSLTSGTAIIVGRARGKEQYKARGVTLGVGEETPELVKRPAIRATISWLTVGKDRLLGWASGQDVGRRESPRARGFESPPLRVALSARVPEARPQFRVMLYLSEFAV